jgi:hypothetical protein
MTIGSRNGPATEGTLSDILTTLGGGGTLWAVIFTTALATKLVVKAAAGQIRSASGRVDSTAPSATYYVQLWNLTDVPADATAVTTGNSLMAPLKVQHVLGFDDTFSFEFGEPGVIASAGIAIGLSTTEFTKTAAGAYLSVTAEYV